MKFRTGFIISLAIHIAVFSSVVILFSYSSSEYNDSKFIELKTILNIDSGKQSVSNVLNSNISNNKLNNSIDDENENKVDIHSYVKNRLDYLAKNNPPDYPEFCRKNNLEGEVVLEIEILTNGQTGNVRVIKNSGHMFFKDAAVEAAKNWDIVSKSGYQLEEDIRIIKKIYFKIKG